MMEETKKARTPHPLSVRLEVVMRSNKGQTRPEICKAMGLPFTTVYDMTRNGEAIKAMAKKAGIYHTLVGKAKSDATNRAMASKVKIAATKKVKKSSSPKKRKKPPPFAMYSMDTKMEVLKRLKKGDSVIEVSEAMNVPRSTLYEMKKYSQDIIAEAQKAHGLKLLENKTSANFVSYKTNTNLVSNKTNTNSVSNKTNTNLVSNKTNTNLVVNNDCQDLFISAPKPRKKGCHHSLPTKLEIVRRSESGERNSDISRATGVAQSTINFILKKARGQDGVAADVSFTTKGSTDIVKENMERLLKIWIDEQLSQPSTLTDDAIRKKALSLWRFVRDSMDPEETEGLGDTFMASIAWLEQFKASFISLPVNVAAPKVKTEPRPKTEARPKMVARAKTVCKPKTEARVKTEVRAMSHTPSPKREVKGLATEKRVGLPKGVSSLLKAKIEVGGYTPRQVINLDELGLLWKKPPSNTIITVDDKDCLRAKDQFSLILGTNATGDLKLKPLLVYHTENPLSLMGYMKEYLPVIWRSHPRGKVVSSLCQNYVVDYISHRCKEYAMEHNLRNRFLLLVDNSSAFPPSMDDWADNIEVMFVPTMSQSVVQPMENGITNTFKLRYFHHLLDQLIRETDGEDKESVRGAWQDYNVRKAVNNIKMAWDDIQPSTLNTAWGSIWPECVMDSPGPAATKETTELDVMTLAHRAGFVEVTVEDIEELLKNPEEDTATENFFQGEVYQAIQLHGKETEIVKTLDITLLSHVLSLFNEAMAVLEDNDPNCTRSCDMRSLVEGGIKSYRELYATKKRKAHNTSILYPDL